MLPTADWLERLRQAGVTPAEVRRLTEGPDTLFSPLRPTRECSLSDDPAAVLVREVFCGPKWHVRFVRGLLVVSDYLGERDDAVMGAGQTTAVLLRTAETAGQVARVLDLGCGAGTLALLLASQAGAVIATDVNPRAVAFCRYNARINGIVNVECREGSLYEPVRGLLFDMIVSQPPYYPGAGAVYLHGGSRGNEIARQVLEGAIEHLATDGRAVIHTAWPADEPAPALCGASLTEYTPGVGEVPGTRHSLFVIEHGNGIQRVDVAPEAWGQPIRLNRPSASNS